ncbi:hypothetical protein KSC_059250 [Ktedonobacter sp. SOSP1-52]|nr:hypothetical protein KSC_059250 [Ktedonobacter sp. SOSP1-52]
MNLIHHMNWIEEIRLVGGGSTAPYVDAAYGVTIAEKNGTPCPCHEICVMSDADAGDIGDVVMHKYCSILCADASSQKI